MNIPHKELEKVRSNPSNYKGANFRQSQGFSVYPTASMFRLALMEYHRNNSLANAISYFESIFDIHRKSTKRNEIIRDEFVSYLELYEANYKRLGVSTFKAFARIAIPVNEEISITGELLRIDMIRDGGYSAYILEKEDRGWEKELRMPLIQSFLANELNCSTGEIRVGLYFYKSGNHLSTSYTPREIRGAFEELSEIGGILVG